MSAATSNPRRSAPQPSRSAGGSPASSYAEELQAVTRAKLRHMFESTSTAGAGGVRLHRC
jgi:hypothetical protein